MLGFLSEAIRNYRQTGAVAPSSRGLARSMVRHLHDQPGPRRILEVGSGTGAFTRHILSGMEDGDRLDAVEISKPFADALEANVLAPHREACPAQDCRVFQCPIEEAPLDGPYHLVVCGLPFNNFPLELTRSIFQIMLGSMHEQGWLSYFEYVGMRTLKFPFVGVSGRAALRHHGALLADLEHRHNGYRRLINMNIPPAWSVHLQGAARP
jgi:phosphatidylethanolamine/phosphatidyl-N-methylethanolamine N-methyltransferase